MFDRVREHFARRAMIEELGDLHLARLDVSRAKYDRATGSCKASFTALSPGGHEVKGSIVLDRQKAFWVGSNHPLAGGYKQ